MRNLILVLWALIGLVSANAQIISLVGPGPTCSGSSNRCVVTYGTMPPNIIPGFREQVYEVRWNFSQAGQMIKSITSSTFPAYGYPSGNAEINGGQLPEGIVRVEVLVKFLRFFPMGLPAPAVYSRTLDFFVGLSSPASLTGPSFLCPGSSGTYNVTPVANAQTYTWEVPSYWTVNGISGPIVSGQGPNVTISVPACDNSRYMRVYLAPTSGLVKVKAVRSSCGSSAYRQQTVFIDYQVAVLERVNDDGTITFFTNYDYFDYYGWGLPLNWQVVSNNGGSSVTVNTFGTDGQLSLRYQSSCLCVYDISYYHVPPEPTPPPPPPPPCCEVIYAYPNPTSGELVIRGGRLKISEVAFDLEGKFQPVAPVGENVRIDVSDLPPGIHILRIKDASGIIRPIRFVKARD